MANPATRKQAADVVEEIARRRLRLPVVAVDGEFIGSGQVDYWEIAQQVGQKIESPKPAG
ncbi:MAG: hypothetical protein M1358_07375 [Chloroflexi bacterium]|nr:hypothetical protein [Chloroflexota bacterium]